MRYYVNAAGDLKGRNGIVIFQCPVGHCSDTRVVLPCGFKQPFIDPTAIIDDDVHLGSNLTIGPRLCNTKRNYNQRRMRDHPKTVIGSNSQIGENCILHANVTIYNNIKIGDRVVIHSGTVIGCDGYGYVPIKNGHQKIPQTGNVIIHDDVEIGSNCAIDRATIGST